MKRRKTFPTISAASSWRVDALHAPAAAACRSRPADVPRGGDRLAGEVRARRDQRQLPAPLRAVGAARLPVRPRAPRLPRSRRPPLDRVQPPTTSRRSSTGSSARGSAARRSRNVLVPCQAFYRRHRRQVISDPTSDLGLPEPGGRRERAATVGEAAALLEPLPGDVEAIYATAFYAGFAAASCARCASRTSAASTASASPRSASSTAGTTSRASATRRAAPASVTCRCRRRCGGSWPPTSSGPAEAAATSCSAPTRAGRSRRA